MSICNSNFENVGVFMQSFGQEVKEKAEFPSEDIIKLRLELITEELGELADAVENKNLVEVADALTDLLYVTYGAGHAFGLPLDVCFNRVHDSNMSKLGENGKPIYREDGKVLKGKNYSPPDLKGVINRDVTAYEELRTTFGIPLS